MSIFWRFVFEEVYQIGVRTWRAELPKVNCRPRLDIARLARRINYVLIFTALILACSYQFGIELQATPDTPKPSAITSPPPTTEILQPPTPAPPPLAPAPVVPTLPGPNYYARGHCTWYLAGKRFIPRGWGNARSWYRNAQSAGWAVGVEPKAGAIAWTSRGIWGHVALVEEVRGNQIYVSEMNNPFWNRTTKRWAEKGEFRYIY